MTATSVISIFAVLAVSAFGARTVAKKHSLERSLDQEDSQVSARQALNPWTKKMIEESFEQECSFRLINTYARIIGEEAIAKAKADTEEKMKQEYEEEWQQVANGTVMELQAIDVMKYPKCAVGAPVLPCYHSLGPMDLLKQRWSLEETLEKNKNHLFGHFTWGVHDDSLDTEKISGIRQLYRQAIKAMKFSASRAKVHCRGEEGKPVLKTVRACLIEKADGNEGRQRLLAKKFQLEDNIATYLAMANKWYDDFGREGRWRGKKEFQDFESQLNSVHKELYAPHLTNDVYEKISQNYSLHLVSDEDGNGEADIKECEAIADPSKLSVVKERVMEELTGTCNEHTDCHERFNQMSPAGYSCDMQKQFTPERTIIGVVLGEIIAMGFYPALGASVAVLTGGNPVAMAASWGMIPNFPVDMIFSATLGSAFSRSIFPTCMSFPLKCDHNADTDVCEMRASSDSQRASSNPFARLPMDGFKCVAHGEGDSKHCIMETCSQADVKAKGPGSLFGRAGVVDGSSYNCANTNRTTSSFLGNLLKLPNPSFTAEVENTVQARNALLKLYSSTADLPPLRAATAEPQPECTAAAVNKIKEQYRIVEGGTVSSHRFQVTCPNELATDENQYTVSCKREDCDGYDWCFVSCGLFGCSTTAPVDCAGPVPASPSE